MALSLDCAKLFKVDGMVAVITGGGSGLGLYAAKALDANGAKAVYIIGRRGGTLKEAAKQAVNGKIIPLVGDVSDKDSLTKVADTVRKEQGYINLLFANAGVSGPRINELYPQQGVKPTNVKDFQEAMWRPSMDEFSSAYHVNCTAVFYTTVAFMDLLDEGNKKNSLAQRSQVLVTSSIAGFSRFPASGFSYSTSKAATTHLVKMMSGYFVDYKIRCNVIAPGLYPSEMTQGSMSQLEKNKPNSHGAFEGAHKVRLRFVHSRVLSIDDRQMSKDRSPEERTGSEQDFAGTVLYMTSQAGAYLDGEVLVTDGGRLSQLPSVY